jgi:hypothetical protein
MSQVQVLVEGPYDEVYVKKIAARLGNGLEQRFRPIDKGGIEPLLRSLRLEIKSPESVVAVICDANGDCQARWAAIKKACALGGLDLGEAELPASGFLLHEPGLRKFGCWIMPDNRSIGAVEAMLLEGIGGDDQISLRKQARTFVDSVTPRLFPKTEAATQKATLRAWFAVQKEPSWVPSHAIASGMLLPQLDANEPFLQWLTALAAMLD